MNSQTVSLILGLIPLAERMIFEVGGKLISLNTKGLTHQDLIAAIEASKSDTWPELKFESPVK